MNHTQLPCPVKINENVERLVTYSISLLIKDRMSFKQ